MKMPTPRLLAAALLAVAAVRVPAGAQVAASADTAPAAVARRSAAAADVRFMRHMQAHHAQALAMTSLVPARSASPAVRLLAERIEVSQRDEIAIMRDWLADHGAADPVASRADSAHAHHGAGHDAPAGHAVLPANMPGMLTADELARLARARGAAFDRLFLEFMVRHHEGALTMVAEYLATPGAAQEPQIFGFAADVDADQRAEIARMRALLARLSPTPRPRS